MKMLKPVLSAAALLLFCAPATSYAQEHATKDDAVKMVKAAVAELQSAGHYKAFNEISDPHGKFVKDDLYIVAYTMDGKCVAHGGDQNLIGQDLSKVKDPDGKLFVQERMTMAKTQNGFWQTYRHENPISHAIAPKQSYCETADDLIVCGGVYGQ